ncbi:TPA: Glu-tRNA(Gln) amidotransferase subunit GatE, partial [Candidatus Bathyarchaeota archaeon]|nr:Glu-tRNA(Gln) amidotransferase subunit GatE [Candidatus Bathyarchaeota archaeon]
VELDEEPPHSLNEEALDAALTVALMLHATPVDEVQVMRKIVIDGSNTSGFQRTSLIATGGYVDVDGKRVPIQTVCLEEDAARKIGGSRFTVVYRLDRMGIPLVEIATAPVINSPREAGRVAEALGHIIMATGKAKTELGAIRQDINLSIRGGSPTEIKGIQRLGLLPKVVRNEVRRQIKLLEMSNELARRGVDEGFEAPIKDVSDVFGGTRCKVIKRALEGGGRALAVRLRGFAGLLGLELAPGYRFGTELAERAVFWSGVGGIFHTDEMPSAGISEREVAELRRRMDAGEMDAVAIVADDPERATDALRAVVDRCREAVRGIPADTRMADDAGVTHYMRPRPGAARIYPETDIPPVRVTPERVGETRARLPELPSERVRRLVSEFGINERLARGLLFSPYEGLFEEIAKTTKVSPLVIAVALTETIQSLRREGARVENITHSQVRELFRLIDGGVTAKEAIPAVLRWLAEHPGATALAAVERLGFKAISMDELESIVGKAIADNVKLVRDRGLRAVGPIIGIVMRKVRGKVDGRLVRETVERKIGEVIGNPSAR